MVRDAVVKRVTAEREAVCAEMASAESELDALVCAPVSGGRDPFEWLPDELLVMIMLMLPCEVLWSGVCERVCLRWTRLMESAPVKRHKRDGRWAACEAGVIKPQEPEGHNEGVFSLAVGLDGKVYSGSNDKTIRVWSGDDGTHLQTLEGHTRIVCALAVGLDGKVYSGSYDKTIRVWCGEDGAHIHTIQAHANVVAIAVGPDGNVCSSCSAGTTICVWSCKDGTLLHTLKHTYGMRAIAFGRDGSLFSGNSFSNKTSLMW